MAVLWLVVSVKLVCEVAGMAWLGRWLLGQWIGVSARAHNPFHRLLGWVVAPAERWGGRWAPAWLLLTWLLATALKLRLCLDIGVAACR